MTDEFTKVTNEVLAALLPEGFSLKDLKKIGKLRPIISPEQTAKAPVAGWLLTLEDMPPRKDGSAWQTFVLELVKPHNAWDGEDEVMLPPGSLVSIPVNKALAVKADVLARALDPHCVHLVVFTVSGTLSTGKVADMWVYETFAHEKTLPREGRFALYNRARVPSHAVEKASSTSQEDEEEYAPVEERANRLRRVSQGK